MDLEHFNFMLTRELIRVEHFAGRSSEVVVVRVDRKASNLSIFCNNTYCAGFFAIEWWWFSENHWIVSKSFESFRWKVSGR